MDCEILETLYLKANGEFPCHDDAGEVVALGSLDDGPSLRRLLEGPGYSTIDAALSANRVPWPGICERCAFFRPEVAYRRRAARRITTFQVEPTLACSLACAGCSRSQQIRTRKGPKALSVDRFEAVVAAAAQEEIEIECIEYCGQGEPLAHPRFHQFVATARRQLPRTRQRLITNGNYDFADVIRNEVPDEIIVSCDGASEASYAQYRRGGSFSVVQSFLADAARSRPRPALIWKYILFEFNDSDAELERAQRLAIDHGVDALLFVVTHSERKSRRYTRENLAEVLKVAPFATVNTTPILEAGNIEYEPEPARVLRASHATGLAPALYVDVVRALGRDTLYVRGWAHDGTKALRKLELTWRGTGSGPVIDALPRPDVKRAFPALATDRLGFAATFKVPAGDGGDSPQSLEIRGRGGWFSRFVWSVVVRERPVR